MHFISCICTCVNFHLLKKAHRPNKENLCTKYSIHGQYWYKLCKDIFSLNYMETVQFLQDLKSDSTFFHPLFWGFYHFSRDFTTRGFWQYPNVINMKSIWNQYENQHEINMKSTWNQYEINTKKVWNHVKSILDHFWNQISTKSKWKIFATIGDRNEQFLAWSQFKKDFLACFTYFQNLQLYMNGLDFFASFYLKNGSISLLKIFVKIH